MGGYDYTAVPAPLLSHNGEKGGPESVRFHGPRRRLGQFPQPLSLPSPLWQSHVWGTSLLVK
jgi:hypothetical protein